MVNKLKNLHPGWKRVDDLVKIVGETRVAPSQAIAWIYYLKEVELKI